MHGSHGGPALVPQRGTGQAADPAAGDGGDPDLLHLRRDQGGRGETAKDRALALRLVIVQMWPKLIIKLIRLLFGGLIRSIFSDLEDVFFWVYQMDLFLGILGVKPGGYWQCAS